MKPPNNRILQRVRRRIHLPAYDSEVRGAVVKKELPFVVGILGAFYGAPPNPWPSLQTREFMEIDRENFNTVMASLGVRLHLRVPSGITSGNSDLECQLIFRSMQDFEPIGVIAQVEPLQRMLQKRGQLASRLVECQNNLSELAGSGDAILEECTSLCKELSLHVSMPGSDILEVLTECMAQIDASVSSQLTEILHHPEFQKLEGSWRGLQYLVMNSETDRQLKLKLLSVTKRDLIRDFEKVGEFDQTHLFKLLQNDVYCSTDGEPIGALIGDYEFTNDPADIQLLEDMSNICAAAHCPFISSVSPDFFDLKRWSDLEQIKDVGSLVMGVRHTKWRAFRDSENSVFVGLTLPCVLARIPYKSENRGTNAFCYNEPVPHDSEESQSASPYDFCWMNAAYTLAAQLTRTYAETYWVTAIQEPTNNRIVENIPACQMVNANDEASSLRSTEVNLAGRRELELSNLGLIPLCYCQQLDRYRFFSLQTCHRPKTYLEPDASANAEIAAKLPCLMTTSRFAHFLQCIVRDTTRRFMYRNEIEDRLNQWIKEYVGPIAEDDKSLSRYPLAEANIRLTDIPGRPGRYRAIALLRPNLPHQQLTVPVRKLIDLPLGMVVQDG